MKRKTLIFLLIVFFIYSSTLLLMSPSQNVTDKTYTFSSRITYINRGQSVETLDPELLTFNVFMNISWQKAYLEFIEGEYHVDADLDGNPIIVFAASPLHPGENMTVSYSMRLEAKVRVPPDIDFELSGHLDEIPEELKEVFCRSEGTWIADENLRSLANNILVERNTTNVLKIVTSIADWIGTNVTDVSHDIPLYAYETYERREGDCDDQSNLLIALCRILEIPAYSQGGSRSIDRSQRNTGWDGHLITELKNVGYHMWAVVYVPPWGWLPFDMTLSWSSWDALSVVKSATIWDLNTLPLFNITVSDWAGWGRELKARVIASDIYQEYSDALVLADSEGFHGLLGKWQFWSIVVAIAGVSIVLWKFSSHRPGKSFSS